MNAPAGPAPDVDGVILLAAFPRALAAAGLPVGADRTATFLAATARLHVGRRSDVYWAGRLTMTGSADEIAVYDRVFEAYFAGETATARRRPRRGVPSATVLLQSEPQDDGQPTAAEDTPPVRAQAASTEVLRHKDMAKLTGAERAELAALIALLRPGLPVRRSARFAGSRRGPVDAHRTVRSMLANGGEPGPLARHRRRTRPRRVVLLIDVSGSMAPYADSLLRFGHVLVRHRPRATEVFTIGTRLSRITRALAVADPDAALAAAAEVIPDYSGGTRLGEVVRAFVDRWGQRGTARGAVVVVFSDGWERSSPVLLAEQMGRLSRLARALVWVNPHKGKTGYLPVQTGIRAVLPHLDHFLAGHSLATLEQLLEVIRRA